MSWNQEAQQEQKLQARAHQPMPTSVQVNTTSTGSCIITESYSQTTTTSEGTSTTERANHNGAVDPTEDPATEDLRHGTPDYGAGKHLETDAGRGRDPRAHTQKLQTVRCVTLQRTASEQQHGSFDQEWVVEDQQEGWQEWKGKATRWAISETTKEVVGIRLGESEAHRGDLQGHGHHRRQRLGKRHLMQRHK